MPIKKRNVTRGDVKGGEIVWTLGLRNVLVTPLKTLGLGVGLLTVSWAAVPAFGTSAELVRPHRRKKCGRGGHDLNRADLLKLRYIG